MHPPRLPWEVMERAIEYSRGHLKTLWSLALTCRQLLPRARLVMFSHVRFGTRDHVFAFVDYLHQNPHLKPAVRSITVWPPNLAPIPLLRILPSLREIIFTSNNRVDLDLALHMHQSTLTCFRLFGTHIRTLSLSHLDFDTDVSFARMLLAFVNTTHLICDGVRIIQTTQRNGGPPNLQETIKRRISQRMQLDTLAVSPFFSLFSTVTSIGSMAVIGRL